MPQLNIRRATVDDLPALLALWEAARLPGAELESRLTEFQVVEADGQFAGALGLQVLRQHARLHSEDYTDFSVAEAAREAFWDRILKMCANHGVFRIWTLETSPFWPRWGFQPATPELLARLPEEWKPLEGNWLTLELKNEEAINRAITREFSGFMDAEKKQTESVAVQAQRIRTIVTVIFFLIGFASFGLALWMYLHRSMPGR